MKKLVPVLLVLSLASCNTGSKSDAASSPPPSLVAIAVTPSDPTVAPGGMQQFAATGTYSDRSTRDLTASVNWSTSDPAVFTIGVTGLATAASAGTGTIQAASAGVTGEAAITVRNAAVEPADDLLYSFYAGFDAMGITDSAKREKIFDISRTDLGLDYLKVSFRWSTIQPASADSFDWTVPDQVAAYAETKGLSIIPFFNQQGTPDWAQNKTPAADLSTCKQGVTFITKDAKYFADYVAAFIARYKGRMSIRYIELENEPNAVCLWPDTAQFLAQVDNATFSAVKNIDPSIKVCSASFHQPLGFPLDASGYPTNLAGDHAYSEQFLKDYLSSLDKGIDCFSLHDYGRIGFTETDTVYPYSSQYDLESTYRAVLDSKGFTNTEIVFTECAHEISTFGNNENYAAAQLVQGYLLAHAKGVAQGRMCQAITNGPTNSADYGITDLTGATPVYYAGYYAFDTLRTLMTAYPKHAQHVKGLVNDNGYWVEKFTDGAGVNALYVAFVPILFDTAKGTPKLPPPAAQQAVVAIGAGKTASITAMQGSTSSLTADGSGNVTLQVTAEPVYIAVP